ncbi:MULTISPECIES: GNAT family N-acetyltransferase [unclassified Arenibacter]|uniref:GNAT family N-acetyltransferase n=1 Tax=unclassified Arenibacter TaxID=2615047 RepID=UPI000E345487|nr:MULTISPECIES: GNAT family N-acetyltransferase [unclassified Arenibacter]MCM4163729.1 N-acetyltransferase [Arenibacter sp. A80]RFT56449.1 N-acetyltransferase [Arenibacter sp. P308M17]
MNNYNNRDNLMVHHEKDNNRFTMSIDGEIAKVVYQLRDDKMYLTYSEVPYTLRGKGYGKELVERTFEQLTKEGYTAVAVCSYIKAVARRSEKWKSIIE